VQVSATATDNTSIVGVRFKLDDVLLGPEVTSPPYTVTWNTGSSANGQHTLVALARDTDWNQTTSAVVTVTVNNNDTTRPTVSVTAPATGASVSGTAVTVSATAADKLFLAGVQFRLDGQNLGAEDTTAPYSISWNTTTVPNGTHTLRAIARDGAGNTRTSTAVSVTVNNGDLVLAPALPVEQPQIIFSLPGEGVANRRR
jgi:hypothetical protein